MFNRVIDTYWDSMSNHWDDKALYKYGVKHMAMVFLNLVTIMILGILFGLLLEGFIFTICYILLRKVSGGFHAKTRSLCYFYSVVLYLIALVCIKYVNYNPGIAVCLGISFLILLRFLPIENSNKKLSKCEKNIYKKSSILVHIGLFLISIVLAGMDAFSISMSIWVAIAGTHGLIILELLRKKYFEIKIAM